MGRPFGSKNSEDASRLRFACRKVTDKIVRAWTEALEAVDGNGAPDHDIRVKAANALADRGYGRPSQSITGEDGGPVDVKVNMADMLRRLVDSK